MSGGGGGSARSTRPSNPVWSISPVPPRRFHFFRFTHETAGQGLVDAKVCIFITGSRPLSPGHVGCTETWQDVLVMVRLFTGRGRLKPPPNTDLRSLYTLTRNTNQKSRGPWTALEVYLVCVWFAPEFCETSFSRTYTHTTRNWI